jgi:hypothetical protein
VPSDSGDSTMNTGFNIFCGGPIHPGRRELVMFSRPLHISYPVFVQEAEAAGWKYSEERRRWLCPECRAAAESPTEDR